MDVRFKTPAIFFVCGQTQSGKSYFVRCMLRHLEELLYPVPTKIIYCYGEYQKEFDELHPSVELVEGFPNNVNELTRGHDNSLIVLDDLMSQCSNDQRVVYRPIYAWFPSPRNVRAIPGPEFISPRQIVTHYQFEFSYSNITIQSTVLIIL